MIYINIFWILGLERLQRKVNDTINIDIYIFENSNNVQKILL